MRWDGTICKTRAVCTSGIAQLVTRTRARRMTKVGRVLTLRNSLAPGFVLVRRLWSLTPPMP